MPTEGLLALGGRLFFSAWICLDLDETSPASYPLLVSEIWRWSILFWGGVGSCLGCGLLLPFWISLAFRLSRGWLLLCCGLVVELVRWRRLGLVVLADFFLPRGRLKRHLAAAGSSFRTFFFQQRVAVFLMELLGLDRIG